MIVALPNRLSSPSVRRGVAPYLMVMVGAAVLLFISEGQVGRLAAAGAYAAAFVSLAWLRPELGLMFVFAAAPFQHDLGGGLPVRFSIAEINLFLMATPLLVKTVLYRKPVIFGPTLLPVIAYLAICILSSTGVWRGPETIISILQIALYLIVAVAVFASSVDRVDRLATPLLGLVVIGVVFSLSMLVFRSNYVLGLNKNGLGASLSTALLVCLELWFASEDPRRTRLLTFALGVITLGLVFSLSRGSWLGAMVGIVIIAARRKQFRLMSRAALIVVPLVAICWIYLPEESRDYATSLDVKRTNISARLKSIDYAWSYFVKDPLFGGGVGLRKQYDATNVVLLTLAETGAPGLGALLLIHVVFFVMVWKTGKALRPSDPRNILLTLGAALVAARFTHGCFDHYWSRGAIMAAWAAAGMAVAVNHQVRQRQLAEPV